MSHLKLVSPWDWHPVLPKRPWGHQPYWASTSPNPPSQRPFDLRPDRMFATSSSDPLQSHLLAGCFSWHMLASSFPKNQLMCYPKQVLLLGNKLNAFSRVCFKQIFADQTSAPPARPGQVKEFLGTRSHSKEPGVPNVLPGHLHYRIRPSRSSPISESL